MDIGDFNRQPLQPPPSEAVRLADIRFGGEKHMNRNRRFSAHVRAGSFSSLAGWQAISITIAALSLCFAALFAARADAEVLKSSIITAGGPAPNTSFTDNTAGGHGDYRLSLDSRLSPDQGIVYDQSGQTPWPYSERLRRIAGDFPAGLVTNPAAIPYGDRCPQDVFAHSGDPGYPKCPVSSRIGSAAVGVRIKYPGTEADPDSSISGFTDMTSSPVLDPGPGFGFDGLHLVQQSEALQSPLYLLQTDHDAPAEAGTVATPSLGFNDALHVKTTIKPIMSGPDIGRLRWITDPLPNKVVWGSIKPAQQRDLAVDKVELLIWGRLPQGNENETNPSQCYQDPTAIERSDTQSIIGIGVEFLPKECRTGKAFITNPTSPGPWSSHVFAQAYSSNTNVDTDVTGSGVTDFVRLDDLVTTPESSDTPALNTGAEATFTNTPRFQNPGFDVTISNPGYAPLDAGQRGADVPKKITAVLPDAVNVDIDQVGRLCEPADFDDRDCPENSKVGWVTIKTPLLRQDLHGDAVLVRQTPGGPGNLPRLGLIVYGDAPFNILSATRYTGNGTQIETTFDNIPQIGFASMLLHIDGGTNGLLKVDRCQAGGADLNDGGPTVFTITGYTGQTRTVSSAPFTPSNCFSSKVTLKKISKCVKRTGTLKVSPVYASRAAVKSAKLSVGKRSATAKKSPFNPKLKLRGLKKGKSYRYKVSVAFKPQGGKSVKSVAKSGSFRTCR